MRQSGLAYSVLFIAAISLLTACGQEPAEETIQTSINQPGPNGEAPQYVEPTLDVLKGKEQPFPSKYPLSRYPRSRVTFARVKPLSTIEPGHKNIVMLNVAEPTKDVIVRYYRNELEEQQWKMVRKWESPSFSSTTWRKGEIEVEVRVCPDQANNQNVQLFYGPTFKRKYPIRPTT